MMMTSLKIASLDGGIQVFEAEERNPHRSKKELQRRLGRKSTHLLKFRVYGESGWAS